jgi:hypothetical protein
METQWRETSMSPLTSVPGVDRMGDTDMRTHANTTIGPKRPKVKAVSGAAGLIVVGLVLAACTSVAGAAKTTTANNQPGQYRSATYPAAPARVSERQQFRAEHPIVLPAKPKLSGTAGDDRVTLRREHLAR